LKHSPGAVSLERRTAIKSMVDELATMHSPVVDDTPAQPEDEGGELDDDAGPGW
jgi:hypothetical protein